MFCTWQEPCPEHLHMLLGKVTHVAPLWKQEMPVLHQHCPICLKLHMCDQDGSLNATANVWLHCCCPLLDTPLTCHNSLVHWLICSKFHVWWGSSPERIHPRMVTVDARDIAFFRYCQGFPPSSLHAAAPVWLWPPRWRGGARARSSPLAALIIIIIILAHFVPQFGPCPVRVCWALLDQLLPVWLPEPADSSTGSLENKNTETVITVYHHYSI